MKKKIIGAILFAMFSLGTIGSVSATPWHHRHHHERMHHNGHDRGHDRGGHRGW